MLDLAKIESGHADWQTEDVDLTELIRQVVDTTEKLIKERDTRLVLDLPNHPCVVTADPDRLMQVLVNLISNAAKFVPRDRGELGIRLSDEGEGFRIGVTDNGPGIAAADQALIFEKFHQGSGGSDKPVGTGLGLPISRRSSSTSADGSGSTASRGKVLLLLLSCREKTTVRTPRCQKPS